LSEQRDWISRVIERQNKKRSWGNLLSLVVRWGRCDVVRSVFSDPNLIDQRQPKQVQEAFVSAIKLAAREPKFDIKLVSFLLDNGASPMDVDIDELTPPQLVPRRYTHGIFSRRGNTPLESFILDMSDLIDGYSQYKTKSNSILMLDLMFWAICAGALELSHVFWAKTRRPLRAALLAQHLCATLAERQVRHQDKVAFEQHAERFDTNALRMLDCIDNEKQAQTLLRGTGKTRRAIERELRAMSIKTSQVAPLAVPRQVVTRRSDRTNFELLGSHGLHLPISILQLAVNKGNREFLKHRYCAAVCRELWRGRCAWTPENRSGQCCLPEDFSYMRLTLMICTLGLVPLVELRPNDLHPKMRPKVEQHKAHCTTVEELSDISQGGLSLNELRLPVRQRAPTAKEIERGLEGKKFYVYEPSMWHTMRISFTNLWAIPAVKGVTHTLFNLLFVALFIWCFFEQALTFGLGKDHGLGVNDKLLDEQIHPKDILMLVWIFSLIVREAGEIASEGWYYLNSALTSYLDMLIIVLMLVMYTIRFVITEYSDWEPQYLNLVDTSDDTPSLIYAYRVLLALAVLPVFWRQLEPFQFHPDIGLMLVSIRKMGEDLLIWMVPMVFLLLAFSFAFLILAPGFLYDGMGSWTVSGPMMVPVWAMFGYFEPSAMDGFSSARGATPIFLLVYLISTILLMLNLVIALFNDSYVAMKEDWLAQEAIIFPRMIKTYQSMNPMPSPLNLLHLVYTIVTRAFGIDLADSAEVVESDTQRLQTIECDACMKLTEQKLLEEPDVSVHDMQDKLSDLEMRLKDHVFAMSEQMAKIATKEQMDKLLQRMSSTAV